MAVNGVVGAQPARKTSNPYRTAVGLVFALFFIFGFITCLNDILMPHLKSMFTLSYTEAALVQFCFFTAYFIASLPSGKYVERKGYKAGITAGLIVTAVGCLLFVPAAHMQSYLLFLFGLFILACGITLIQVAVNPYIAILGPAQTSSSRLTLAQAFNSLGTTIAPIFGSVLILSAVESTTTMSAADTTNLHAAQAASIQGPYIGLAAVLILLAVIVGLAHMPVGTGSTDEGSETVDPSRDLSSAWKYRHLILGAVGIFCYVGAEVSIGSYMVNFITLPEISQFPEATAAKYVALYWGGAMVGRFIGSAALRKFQPRLTLAFNAAVACVLILLGMFFTGSIAIWTVLSIGLFNSIMFPTIFTLGIAGLGKNTAQGSGILCMAIVGGAVVPLLQGKLADVFGLHHSYILPVLCYIYIAFFGLVGSRQTHARATELAA